LLQCNMDQQSAPVRGVAPMVSLALR
jgi:hypothetical protein